MPLFVPDSRRQGLSGEWAMIEERREEKARGRQELPETPTRESAHQHRDVPSGERDAVALLPLHLVDAAPSSSTSRCASYAPRSPRTTGRCEFFDGAERVLIQ